MTSGTNRDWFETLLASRWLIVRNMLLTGAVVAVLLWLLPHKYTAYTTFFPPEEPQGVSALELLTRAVPPEFRLGAERSPADLAVEILKSRAVCMPVLNSRIFDGRDSVAVYRLLGFRDAERAYSNVFKFAHFLPGKLGMVRIEVTTRWPAVSASLANAFVDQLDAVERIRRSEKAQQARQFYEEQLELTDKRVKKAAKALADFQRQYGIFQLDKQTTLLADEMARIRAEVLAKQIQLAVMSRTMLPANPAVVKLKAQIDELEKAYRDVEAKYVRGGSGGEANKGNLPALALEWGRLRRELKIQENLWELINQLYHQARIQEVKNTPTLQVLDRAVAPSRPSWPDKKRWLVVFVLLGGFFSVLYVFFEREFEALRRVERPDSRWQLFLLSLQQDLRRASHYLSQVPRRRRHTQRR